MLTVAALDARVINVASQVEQEMQCPFYSGGLFVTEERSECGDDFMEVAPRQLPDCKGHCCRLQHSTGSQPSGCCRAFVLLLHGNFWEQWQLCSILLRCKVWTKTKASSSRQGMHPRRQAAHFCCLAAGAFLKKATETQPHQLQFQPGGSGACRFEQYSRAEVLAALQGSGADGAADAHPGMDILVRSFPYEALQCPRDCRAVFLRPRATSGAVFRDQGSGAEMSTAVALPHVPFTTIRRQSVH